MNDWGNGQVLEAVEMWRVGLQKAFPGNVSKNASGSSPSSVFIPPLVCCDYSF